MSEERSLSDVMKEIAECKYTEMNGGNIVVGKELWLKIADALDDKEAEHKTEIRDCFQPFEYTHKLEPWQRRLKIEYKQVSKRRRILSKLINYYFTGKLDFKADIGLMIKQSCAMFEYMQCLKRRAEQAGIDLEEEQ